MSFNIAVSGLKAATANLDVTGNNIANGNTVGFKRSRAEFADVYAVSNLGSSQDAIGQGVQVASISQQFSQGTVTFTDQSLDLAINGPGFFVLDDAGTRAFSRAGAFGVDKEGFVTNTTGQQLVGFEASNGTVTGALGPLQLDTTILPPAASSRAEVEIGLSQEEAIIANPFDPADTTSYNNDVSLAVYDSLGGAHLATMYFRKTALNQWETHLRVDGDNAQTLTPRTMNFTDGGVLLTAMPVNYGAFTPTNGAAAFSLDVDFTKSTQHSATFEKRGLSQNGYTTGQLTGVDIDGEGLVNARFSNGQSTVEGQVAIANFGNAQGLQPVSETNWAETSGSGPALIGAPGSASLGLVQSGALEESNVDLSEELVNMIVAQRSFQANAQMIRTEDEVTQTIINIR